MPVRTRDWLKFGTLVAMPARRAALEVPVALVALVALVARVVPVRLVGRPLAVQLPVAATKTSSKRITRSSTIARSKEFVAARPES